MLSSSLKLTEKYDYLADKFKTGYRWLAEHDINSMQDGKYEIQGKDVFADVQSYETEPAENRKFEAHDVYFDIQYMASGCEMFGVCHREGLKLKEAPEGKDVKFFEDPESCSMVLLEEGDLIVVAPEEAHKPRCAAGKPAKVKKVVINVKV